MIERLKDRLAETGLREDARTRRRVTARPPPRHDVADLGLAPLGRQRIEWADRDMPVLRRHPRALRPRDAPRGPARLGLPARDHRDGQPGAHAARPAAPTWCSWPPTRSRPRTTSRPRLVAGLRHRHLRPPRARTTTPTTAHITRRDRPRAAHHDGRRRRRRSAMLHARAAREMLDGRASAAPRRPPPASSACGRWRPRAACALPGRSRSTTPRPSTCSTTATAPASRRSTASCAPPTSCSPAAGPSWPATAGAAAAWPRALRGMGANVIVTEVNPLRALEAVDGRLPGHADRRGRARRRHLHHRHRRRQRASASEHFAAMKDGAILANTGHFNVEIDLPGLAGAGRRRCARCARSVRGVRDARRPPASTCWPRGACVNLAAAEGHPAAVMDMSFANQALSAEYLAREGRRARAAGLRGAAREIDDEIARAEARRRWASSIDTLTDEQRALPGLVGPGHVSAAPPATAPAAADGLAPHDIIASPTRACEMLDQTLLPGERGRCCAARLAARWSTPSGGWPSAARPRSGWPGRWAWPWRRRGPPATSPALRAEVARAAAALRDGAAHGGQPGLGGRRAGPPGRRAPGSGRRRSRARPRRRRARRSTTTRCDRCRRIGAHAPRPDRPRRAASSPTATPGRWPPGGYGTALGVVRAAHAADPTRARAGAARPARCSRARGSRPGSSARDGHPVHADRRRDGRLDDGRGRRHPRRGGRRPHRRQRRRRQQDRHLRPGRAGPRARHPVHRGRAHHARSTSRTPIGRGHPHRGALGRRGARAGALRPPRRAGRAPPWPTRPSTARRRASWRRSSPSRACTARPTSARWRRRWRRPPPRPARAA